MEDCKQQKKAECGGADASHEGQRPPRLGTKAGPSFETIVAASRRLPLSPRSSCVGVKPPSPKYVGLRSLGMSSVDGSGNEEIEVHSNPKKGSPRRSFRNFHHTIDTGFANVRGSESNNSSPVAGSGASSQRDTRTEQPSRPQLSVTDQRFSAMVKTASPAAAFAAARGSKPKVRKTDALRSRTDIADSTCVRSFTVNTEAEGKKNLSETEINKLVRSSIEKARRHAKMSKASNARDSFEQSFSYKTVSQTILASAALSTKNNSTIEETGIRKSSCSEHDVTEGRQDDSVDSQSDEAASQLRNSTPSNPPAVPDQCRLDSMGGLVDSLDSTTKAQPSPRSPARQFFSGEIGEAQQKNDSNCSACASASGKDKATTANGLEPHCRTPTSHTTRSEPHGCRSPTTPGSVHSIKNGSSTLSERVQVSLERAKLAREEIAELLHEGHDVSNSKSRVDLIVAETMRRAKEAADKDSAASSVTASNPLSTKLEIEARAFPAEPTSPCSINSEMKVNKVDTAISSSRTTDMNKSEPILSFASDISQVVLKTIAAEYIPSSSQSAPQGPSYADTHQEGRASSVTPHTHSLIQESPPEGLDPSIPTTSEGASASKLTPIPGNPSACTLEEMESVSADSAFAENPVMDVPTSTDTQTKLQRNACPKITRPEKRTPPLLQQKSDASAYIDLLMSMSLELKESLAAARPNDAKSANSSCSTWSDSAADDQGSKCIKSKVGGVCDASSVPYKSAEQQEHYVIDNGKKTKIIQSTLTLGDAPDIGLEVALISQSTTSFIDEPYHSNNSSKTCIDSVQDDRAAISEQALQPYRNGSESFLSAVQDHPESNLRTANGTLPSARQSKESSATVDEIALVEGFDTVVGKQVQECSLSSEIWRPAETETTQGFTPNNMQSEDMKSLHTGDDDCSKDRETLNVETTASVDDEFLGTTILSPVMPSDAGQLTGRSCKYSRSMPRQRRAGRKHGNQRLARSPSHGSQDTITVTEEFLAEIASRKGATLTTDELHQLLRAAINPKLPPSKIETIESSGSDESVHESNAHKTESLCQSEDRDRNATLSRSRSGQESRVSRHSLITNGSRSSQESILSALRQEGGPCCVDFVDILRQIGFRDVAEESLLMNEGSLVNRSLSGSSSDGFISDDETNNESEHGGDEVTFVADEHTVNQSKYDVGDDDSIMEDKKSSIVRSEEETFEQETTGSVSYESAGETFDKGEVSEGETHESFQQQDHRRITFSFSDGQYTLDDFVSTSSEDEDAETGSSVHTW